MPRPFTTRALLAALLAILGGATDLARQSRAAAPNFIFILADDVGYGDLGCYGQKNFATPRLDRMAAEGMRFTQHYAGSTVCAPSRACLLTGQHTGHVYQRANGPYQFREDPLDKTIAGHLQAAGYLTAMIGKSGLSCNSDDGGLPNRKGFDEFFGYTSHRAAHRYYPKRLWHNGKSIAYRDNRGKEGTTYSGDLFRKLTLRYLDERAADSKPFFLHLSLQQAHADLQVPDAWRQRFLGKYEEPEVKPGGYYRYEPNPKATYAAMMAYLDDTVGRVLDKLNELGMAGNTLVLFASDNGAMSEGGWSRRYFESSGPLRGGKRDLYEGGVRTPLIAWRPGMIKPGGASDHVSAFWDFAPTVCDLAGLPPMPDADGVSYAPTLRGDASGQAEHGFLYWEFHEAGGKQAVRLSSRPSGEWKGVRLGVGKDRQAPIELYDLRNDLGEQNNVAAQHPQIVAEIAAAMNAAHVESPIVKFAGEKPE